jgi:hypothetical protein
MKAIKKEKHPDFNKEFQCGFNNSHKIVTVIVLRWFQ